MKSTPILFSTLMVQANLQGLKTQTRRLINPRTPEAITLLINLENGINIDANKAELIRCACPYGNIGDQLWVRETWTSLTKGYAYKADGCFIENSPAWKWKPSIHMPRVACRLLLEITNIRVECLQEITEADAVAEGCIIDNDGWPKEQPDPSGKGLVGWESAQEWYAWLWEEINGNGSWEINPWVWVIEYKVIKE